MKQLSFKDYIKGPKVISINDLKKFKRSDQVYFLFGGTFGSGKTTFAKEYLAKFPIVDADEFSLLLVKDPTDNNEMRKVSNKALMMKKEKVKEMFNKKYSFVEMGSSANVNSTINKIKFAKELGYKICFIAISTGPEESLKRNRERIANGGRGVSPDKEFRIYQAYYDFMETVKEIKKLHQLDYILEVKK